jgi:hypothetical protein
MKPSKAVIAGAAVAGLLSGSFAVRAYAASPSSHPGVSLQTMADTQNPLPKHACKGQNDCKGQGGGKHPGKNSCKGKGGCATDGSKPQ